MLLQSTDRDELRTEREIRREPSSPPRSYKQHRSSLSSGSVESRMAELDDIQRSMEVEETEEEELDTARIKREPYDTDSDSVSSGREGGTYPHHGARVQCQQPPSPVEPYINNNVSGMDSRIATHEWTFEEQFKQVSSDLYLTLLSVCFCQAQIPSSRRLGFFFASRGPSLINLLRLKRILLIIVPHDSLLWARMALSISVEFYSLASQKHLCCMTQIFSLQIAL